jgi:fatty acid desaturase
LFNINLNYHLEHHLFPGVPWYNLPKVHRILLDDYTAAGSSIYRSYTRFLIDAFRAGIYGKPLS